MIRSHKSSTVFTSVRYTPFFKWSHKKSRGFKSGDRGGHAIGPPRPIHRTPCTWLRKSRTCSRKWGVHRRVKTTFVSRRPGRSLRRNSRYWILFGNMNCPFKWSFQLISCSFYVIYKNFGRKLDFSSICSSAFFNVSSFSSTVRKRFIWASSNSRINAALLQQMQALIFSFGSRIVWLLTLILSFKSSHRKKSDGVKSLDLSSQSIWPFRKKTWPEYLVWSEVIVCLQIQSNNFEAP